MVMDKSDISIIMCDVFFYNNKVEGVWQGRVQMLIVQNQWVSFENLQDGDIKREERCTKMR